jgi:hypothetical protein
VAAVADVQVVAVSTAILIVDAVIVAWLVVQAGVGIWLLVRLRRKDSDDGR